MKYYVSGLMRNMEGLRQKWITCIVDSVVCHRSWFGLDFVMYTMLALNQRHTDNLIMYQLAGYVLLSSMQKHCGRTSHMDQLQIFYCFCFNESIYYIVIKGSYF
jgi:hypothetical protein